MRYLVVLLTLLPTCALAQELSVEDRAASPLPPPSCRRLPRLRSREAVRCRNRRPRDGVTRNCTTPR